jgi:hypothetical protein
MARQPQDNRLVSLSVDATMSGLRVSVAGPPPDSPEVRQPGGDAALPAASNADDTASTASPPSFLGLAASFAGSMAKFAASGFKRVNQQTHTLRMSRCQLCEYRRQTRCTCCGCFVAKKAWLPHEDCPIGRWPQ